jgi:hypothetical protein
MSSKNSSSRRRGAPIANTNAVTHGFYSRRFRKTEVQDLENAYFSGINDEIAMLRVCIRRAIEWGKDIQSLPEALDFLRTISLAAGNLSRLVRTQKIIAGSGLDLAIEQTILAIGAELGIYDSPEGASTSSTASNSESLESALLSALSGKKAKANDHID